MTEEPTLFDHAEKIMKDFQKQIENLDLELRTAQAENARLQRSLDFWKRNKSGIDASEELLIEKAIKE